MAEKLIAVEAMKGLLFPIITAIAFFFIALGMFRGNGTARCNVILVSIDTLRDDHLGCYGYRRETSPNIDRFAGESVVFLNTRAHAPSTAPSHASLFTSLTPRHHGVSFARKRPIPESLSTMAELLKKAGYRTVSFNDGAQVAAGYGFDQGFDIYRSLHKGAIHARFSQTVDETAQWFAAEKDLNAPYFLFLHTYEVHHPYTPDESDINLFDGEYSGWVPDTIRARLLERINSGELQLTRKDREHIIAAYDAEIRRMDRSFGTLMELLKNRGEYHDSLIVLTSDHGEEFGEHGQVGWHSHTLYEELLRVPLIIKFPHGDFALMRVETPVRLIDVLPTLLDALGMESPDVFEGESLTGLLTGEADLPRPVTGTQDVEEEPPPEMLRSGSWKLYRKTNPVRLMLFDLEHDPHEKRDQASAYPEVVKQMNDDLTALTACRPCITADRQVEMTGELLEQLQSLGYVAE